MPPRYGFRLDNRQDLGPAPPEPSQEHPEQPIDPAEKWPVVFAFEDAYLVTQGGQLKPEVMPTAKERPQPTQETHKKADHQASVRDQGAITDEESRLRLNRSLASGSGFGDRQEAT